VDGMAHAGTLISLYSPDMALIVAHGHITPDHPRKHLRINITKTWALVTITEILIPGHLVSGELLPSQTDTKLAMLSRVPFNMVCKSKHLQTYVKQPFHDAKPSLMAINPPPSVSSTTRSPNVLASSKDSEFALHADSPWFKNMDEMDPSEQSAETSVPDPVGIERAQALKCEGDHSPPMLPSHILGI
jgi:hypothetical protein